LINSSGVNVPSSISSDNQSTKVEWIHCNQCLHPTKHSIIAHHKHIDEGPQEDWGCPWWEIEHTLFICCGCESITLRRHLEHSEWEEHSETEFYPPQVSRRQPKWHDKLPYEIQELLCEIYTALHSNSRRLALMGVRTVIDIFMLDKIGEDIGTFNQKLQALVDRGYLGSQQKDILNVALDAGHAAAHRGYQPSPEVLNHTIDVVESLLQSYALEKDSNLVKGEIPSKSKAKQSNSPNRKQNQGDQNKERPQVAWSIKTTPE
jgi:hypothetical protein